MHTGCGPLPGHWPAAEESRYSGVVEMVRIEQHRRTVPWIALGVVYVLWGSTYLANRFIIVSMPPLLASGFRFMTGGVLLGILVLLFAGPRAVAMTRVQLGTAALSGVLLPAWGNGLVILAQSQVASGLTALLIASVPLYIAVLRALTGDRPRRATVLGVLVGAAALALLVLVGPSAGSEGVSGSAWWGPPLVLLAGAGWATGTFAAARMAVPANPFALATLQQLIGGAVLVAIGTIVGERLHPATVAPVSWWAWLYMSLFVSLGAFSAYAYALATLPVSTVATYAYVNPVIAVVLGVVVAGERFSPVQLAGGAIVLLAVVMVIAAERPVPGDDQVRLTGTRELSVVGGSIAAVDSAAGNREAGNRVDVIGPAAARRAALAAQGFADARPSGAGGAPAPRAAARPDPAAAAGLGERRGPRPLHAGLQPARALRPGAGRRRRLDALGPPAPAAGGVLGARGEPAPGRRLAAAAVRRQAARDGGGTTRRSRRASRSWSTTCSPR